MESSFSKNKLQLWFFIKTRISSFCDLCCFPAKTVLNSESILLYNYIYNAIFHVK